MQASAHPLHSDANRSEEPAVPPNELFTHIHAAVGEIPDGRRVPGYLPAKRAFPVDYVVSGSYSDVVDGEVEDVQCPFTIIGNAEIGEKEMAEVREELLEADSLTGPAWLPSELAGARFDDGDLSWLGAWQAHQVELKSIEAER